ncbi:hypothetical protein [Burkholderia cepacia]|uniref:hypothetical protein n=1 Tax=Burkholderia cepacia TaxID=292 RepID=UPI002AB65A0B|nr:hypothetical protein [Burkholderia cepacia]
MDAATATLPSSAGAAMAVPPNSKIAPASKAAAFRRPDLPVTPLVPRGCRMPVRAEPARDAGPPSPPGAHGRPVCRFEFMSETARRLHRERHVLSSFLIVPQHNQL